MAKWITEIFRTINTNLKGSAMTYFQQGDVLLFKEPIPSGAIDRILDPVIMHGESGHKHKLMDYINFTDSAEAVPAELPKKRYEILKDPNSNVVYLRIFKPSDLVHEEHKKITLPPGDYRVGQVREKGMFDDMIAPVLD